MLRNKEGNPYPICKTSLGQLGEHGSGIMLYLMFIKWMALGFAIMSILSIAPLICNIVGNGISNAQRVSILDHTTLGNQENVLKEVSSSDDDVERFNRGKRLVVIWFDILYTWFFVIYLTVFKIWT